MLSSSITVWRVKQIKRPHELKPSNTPLTTEAICIKNSSIHNQKMDLIAPQAVIRLLVLELVVILPCTLMKNYALLCSSAIKVSIKILHDATHQVRTL